MDCIGGKLILTCLNLKIVSFLPCVDHSNPGVDAVPAFLNRIVLHLLVAKRGLYKNFVPRWYQSQNNTI